MFLESSLSVGPVVGPCYFSNSSGDDPVSPGSGVKPQSLGKSHEGSTKTSDEAHMEQDLYEGRALSDGGLPADDDG
jgi:hypothetical protein